LRIVLLLLLGSSLAALYLRKAEPLEPGAISLVDDFDLLDTRGLSHTRAEWRASKAVVLCFLATECPVSNAYAPELRRLADVYRPRGVAFFGVHSDPDVTADQAARHAKEYGLSFPVLLDPAQELAGSVGVKVTPEVALVGGDGRVFYHGRVDDTYLRDGKHRTVRRTHDLQNALEAVLADRVPADATGPAFGCPLPPARVVDSTEAVTYAKHVAPILGKHCVSCHRPGEIGPFSLATYRDAAKRASFLATVTESRRMPPWKPHLGFGEFRDEARLTRREQALLAAWAAAGAPEGDPGETPPLPDLPKGWRLGTPDLELALNEPFVVPAEGDVYRAFVIPIPLDHDQGVSAVEFLPDNRRIVHHARLYADSTDDSRRKDREDAAPGFIVMSGNDITKPGLGAWIPGVVPQPPPPGVGYVIKAKSDLVVLIHYHGSGKPEVDRSRIGVYFSKTPITRLIQTIPLSTAKIDIPAGEAHHRIVLHANVPVGVHAYNVLPHGHFLMRDIKLWATLPDGRTRRLLWIDDWDFAWQGIYHFAEPVALPKGTKLHVIATYDNSADNPFNPNVPPARVRFGPASTDEMLGCHIQILTDVPEEESVVRAKWPRSL
jgi:peroxiredoxin